jgi:hypothetical protein
MGPPLPLIKKHPIWFTREKALILFLLYLLFIVWVFSIVDHLIFLLSLEKDSSARVSPAVKFILIVAFKFLLFSLFLYATTFEKVKDFYRVFKNVLSIHKLRIWIILFYVITYVAINCITPVPPKIPPVG